MTYFRQITKTIILALVAIVFLQCNAAATDNTHTTATAENPHITIQVDGASPGTARLVGMLADQQFVADTSTVDAQGRVVFQKDEPYQQGFYYILLPNSENFQLLLSEDQTFSVHTHINDLKGLMKIEGQIDNQLLYQNLVFEADYQNRYQVVGSQFSGLAKTDPKYNQLKQQREALLQERENHLEGLYAQAPNSLFTAFKKAGQNPELKLNLPDQEQIYWYRQEFWNTVDFKDERLLSTPVISNKFKRYFKDLTPQHPDSILSATAHLLSYLPTWENSEYFKYFVNAVTLMYEPTETTLMDAEAVYVNMVKKYFTYEHAFWTDSTNIYALQLRAEEMGNSLVGQLGPNVSVPDANGVKQTLYDLKAPYLIVYLYNPDCEHCQEQTPELVSLHNKWQAASQPLADVYAIAIDTDKDKWLNYVQKTGMNWTNVFDPSNKSIYKTYFVNVTPELYVLNPERKIIGKNLNVNQVEEVIRRDQLKQ